MKPSPSRTHRGFSLLEILVALVIIGMLAGLIGPAVSNAIRKARAAACLANLRQLGLATQGFTQESNGYMPDIGWWAQEILPYAGPERPYHDIFWCPAATRAECPVIAGRTLSQYTNTQLIPISYGINANFPSNNGQYAYGNYGSRSPERRVNNIPNPSKVVLYLDQAGGYANLFYDTQARFSTRHAPSSNPSRMGLNGVFVDGHVESLSLDYSTATRSPWRSMFDAVW